MGNKPLLYHSSSTGYAFTNQIFAEYARDFGQHSLSMLGGFEQYYEKDEQYWAQRENYDFPIDQMSVGSANTMKNDGGEGELGRAAWIAQAKYNYMSRYYAEASLRYDGSDYFAPGKRWGAFFSGCWDGSLRKSDLCRRLRNATSSTISNSVPLMAKRDWTRAQGALHISRPIGSIRRLM